MIRKLELNGEICNRGKKVTSYYSWPRGTTHAEVDRLITAFERAFCNTSYAVSV